MFHNAKIWVCIVSSFVYVMEGRYKFGRLFILFIGTCRAAQGTSRLEINRSWDLECEQDPISAT